MKNSINRSEEFEHLYQNLGNSKDRFFENMKDVFMLALVVGATSDNKKPFTKTGGDPIRLSVFDDQDRNIMDIVALIKTKDISILINEESYVDAKYKIIEEYANGGMEVLNNAFCKPVPSMERLKDFVLSYKQDSKIGRKVDITEILDNAVKELTN